MGEIIIDYLEKSFLELLLGTEALVISLVQGQGRHHQCSLKTKLVRTAGFLGSCEGDRATSYI